MTGLCGDGCRSSSQRRRCRDARSIHVRGESDREIERERERERERKKEEVVGMEVCAKFRGEVTFFYSRRKTE